VVRNASTPENPLFQASVPAVSAQPKAALDMETVLTELGRRLEEAVDDLGLDPER
jgi:hypothetical protein